MERTLQPAISLVSTAASAFKNEGSWWALGIHGSVREPRALDQQCHMYAGRFWRSGKGAGGHGATVVVAGLLATQRELEERSVVRG